MAAAKYTVSSRFLAHDGGTKSYEAVVICGGPKSIVVTRWGKNSAMQIAGGGECGIAEHGSNNRAFNAWDKIVSTKCTPRAGGVYQKPLNPAHRPGLPFACADLNAQMVDERWLLQAIGNHYDASVQNRICHALELPMPDGSPFEAEENEVIEELPIEVDPKILKQTRGEEWGSW